MGYFLFLISIFLTNLPFGEHFCLAKVLFCFVCTDILEDISEINKICCILVRFVCDYSDKIWIYVS